MTGIGKHQKVSKHENDCRNQGLKKNTPSSTREIKYNLI